MFKIRNIIAPTVLLSSLLSFSSFGASSYTVDRLSLFISDGTTVYEDQRIGDIKSMLPPGIELDFKVIDKGADEKQWQWTFKNTTNKALNNLRVTGLIDVDINATNNTFHNEFGGLLKLDAPKGYTPADKWEVSEPGYYTGDLIKRAGKGALSNRTTQTTASADDAAMALSIDIGSLRSREELEVIGELTSIKNEGLKQTDLNDKEWHNFLLYAKKGFKGAGGAGLAHGSLITTGAAVLDESVYVWGFRGSSQQGNGTMIVSMNTPPAKVYSLSNIQSSTAGAYHLVALDDKGNVYGWGQSIYGETGCYPTQGSYVSTPCVVLKNATQIAAGEYFSVALDNNGQVWTWGHNLYGQLGNGSRTNSRQPIAVNLRGEKARLIGGAYEGAFAVTHEGHVWAWGDNEASGLGFQGTNYGVQQVITTPTRVTNLDQYADQIVHIAGGNGWGEALLGDGTVIGWGMRASLGVGISKTNVSSPVPVVILTNVRQLFARYVGSFALTNDGKLYTWGQTGGSAFPMVYGHSATLRNNVRGNVINIGGGKEHLFYQTEDGKVYGVGYNDLYKLNQYTCCAPNVDWPGAEIRIK